MRSLVITAAVLLGAAAPARKAEKPAAGPATPRACWEAVDAAARDNDQGRFWDLLSTKARTAVTQDLRRIQLGMAAGIKKNPANATRPVAPDGKLTWGEAVTLAPRDFFVRGTQGQPTRAGPKKTAFVYERVKGKQAEVAWDEDGRRVQARFVREDGAWRYDETPRR